VGVFNYKDIYLKTSHMKLTESEKKEILKLYLKEDVDFNSIIDTENAGPCFQKMSPDLQKLLGANKELIGAFKMIMMRLDEIRTPLSVNPQNLDTLKKFTSLAEEILEIQKTQFPVIVSSFQNLQKY
jgi:hypothetical protein